MWIEEQKGEFKMSKEKINRKLEVAKQQLQEMQNKLNKEPPQERVTKNMCPPVPEMPDNKNMNEKNVPGVITGGPKRSNKHKQV